MAKVFVNVDVGKALPKEISFSKNGKEFVVGFHFPWLPARCKRCDKWGHTEEVCGMHKKVTEKMAEKVTVQQQELETNKGVAHSQVENREEDLRGT